MKLTRPTTPLALALAAAFPAAAQSNADCSRSSRPCVSASTSSRQQAEGHPRQARRPPAPQWGMTPEQARELNRIAVKTEAMEDAPTRASRA